MFRPPITPAIREVCQRYHIRRLALFGSRLTSDFRADSDLDIWGPLFSSRCRATGARFV
jgi:predicted nucleotidyltransferase